MALGRTETRTEMLDIWTVYLSPKDFPGRAVARRFVLDQPTEQAIVARTIDEVRAALPPGLECLPRQPGDDPCIVEVWL